MDTCTDMGTQGERANRASFHVLPQPRGSPRRTIGFQQVRVCVEWIVNGV